MDKQVLYRRDRSAERISPEHLSLMRTSAVRESLANVFGDNVDGLTRNFEQSFDSTLNTLRLIYESTTAQKGSAFGASRREILTSKLTLDKGDCKRDVAKRILVQRQSCMMESKIHQIVLKRSRRAFLWI